MIKIKEVDKPIIKFPLLSYVHHVDQLKGQYVAFTQIVFLGYIINLQLRKGKS
jgi:hypothetical protein